MPSAMTIVPAKCLCCDADLTTPVVCEKCHSLHPIPDALDHFALLGLQRGYELDPAELERRFLARSRETHPDFFTGEPAAVQVRAVRLSAEVNEGYRVLKDPVLRAEYLLELSGGPSATEDKSLPDGFLPQIMMVREEVEEAMADQNRPALDEHGRQIAAQRERACERIASLADRLPAASNDEKRELRRLLNSIKYYDNVIKLLA